MIPKPNEFVTLREFDAWREGDADFRKEVKDDLKELLGLVRTQNGRLFEAEKKVSIIERDIKAVISVDGATQKAVESIQKEGCHQFHNHREVLNMVDGSGAMRDTDGPPRPRWPSVADMTSKQKAVAGVGITALMIPAVSDLLQLGKAIVTWLAAIHGN